MSAGLPADEFVRRLTRPVNGLTSPVNVLRVTIGRSTVTLPPFQPPASGKEGSILSRLRLCLISAFAILAFALALSAGPLKKGEVEILTGADSSTVEVNLKPLEPLSPGMRAILAFYAMRANGGCPPGEWTADGKTYEMRCPLTTALGLGFQCSPAQLDLVKTWFKDGIPPLELDRAEAARIVKTGDFASACNATPDGATHQVIWSTIRVLPGKKGSVTIEGSGDWTSGPEGDSGSFHNVATYRILPDRVVVVSYRGE